MTASNAFVPTILMIAALALLVGGTLLFRRGDRQRGVLMIVAGIVFIGNVVILTLPAAP